MELMAPYLFFPSTEYRHLDIVSKLKVLLFVTSILVYYGCIEKGKTTKSQV